VDKLDHPALRLFWEQWWSAQLSGGGERFVELPLDRCPVRDSHEPGNRVVGESFSIFISPEMFACDIDLLAARLGLSEVQVGHKGKESSLVLWFEAIDLQGIV
jgi:hypothetical protein